jgi:hypothetical protein
MAFCANRRLLCLLTVLVFAISGVAQVYAATASMMQMPAAAMDAPDHGMGGCGGNDKTAHTACVAMCATAVAILCEPAAIPMAVAMQDLASAPEAQPTSHGRSPDTPPPKS